MLSELDNIRKHWTRYRDVTLKHLEMLAEEEMAWRQPGPDVPDARGTLDRPADSEWV